MQDLTAHQRPDGMFELQPEYKEQKYRYAKGQYTKYLKDKAKFEQANPPIPTDDKDLVEGQKVERGDYEEVHQFKCATPEWKDIEGEYLWMPKEEGYPTRTILRKKSNLPSVQPIAESHIKPEFEGKELYMDGEWKQVEPIADNGESKWISVEERLPEENGNVLVHCCYTEVKSCYYSAESKSFHNAHGIQNYVKNWQPLPEPPTK